MSNQNRVPEGLPTGGQFAATSKTEASLEPLRSNPAADASEGTSWDDWPSQPFKSPLSAAEIEHILALEGIDDIAVEPGSYGGTVYIAFRDGESYRAEVNHGFSAVIGEDTDVAVETYMLEHKTNLDARQSFLRDFRRARELRADVAASNEALSGFETPYNHLYFRAGELCWFEENVDDSAVRVGPFRSASELTGEPCLEIRLGSEDTYEISRGATNIDPVVRRADGTVLPKWEAAGVLGRVDAVTSSNFAAARILGLASTTRFDTQD